MNNQDTIAAIATGPGAGGVGIIRISGPDALAILGRVFRRGSSLPEITGQTCLTAEQAVNAQKTEAAASSFVPRMMHYGHVMDGEHRVIDEALAVFFPGPHSFTGENCAEIQGHGGPAVLNAVLDACLTQGARQAEGGEFTRRAFLNGRMDLTQAEAVAELIAAPGLDGVRLASAKLDGILGQRILQLRDKLEYLRQRLCLAIDFPEEEAECLPPEEFLAIVSDVGAGIEALLAGYQRSRPWSEGAQVVLMGQVNAGKSSLMNALLGRPRAIVTAAPGTTRDYLEEHTSLDGMPAKLVDTAGLRGNTDDPIEQEGMRLGLEMAQKAQAVLIVMDGKLAADKLAANKDALTQEKSLVETLGANRCIPVWNKCDLAPLPAGMHEYFGSKVMAISARHGEGIDELAHEVRLVCAATPPLADEIAPNLRQARTLSRAREELLALEEEINLNIPPDLCSIRLESAAALLADITGLNSTEETLNAIFEDFCIGK